MNVEFYKSRFAIYFLPTITLLDYRSEKQVRFSFIWWHLVIEWRTRV